MKIRKGFVSNSSSSSFVCDVCNESASGMDMCLSDAQMFECIVGHVVCDDHELSSATDYYNLDLEGKRAYCLEFADLVYISKDKIKEIESEEELDNIYSDDVSNEERYYKPKSCCPCCQLKEPTTEQILEFLLAERKSTREDVIKQIQEQFNDYDEMSKKLGI